MTPEEIIEREMFDRAVRTVPGDGAAITAALTAAGYEVRKVDPGMVYVPREPTLNMQNAGWREIDKQGFQTEDTEVAPIYRAMISAVEKG